MLEENKPNQYGINQDEVLLITGSLNVNKEDRHFSREEIIPVQLFMDNKIQPVSFFNSLGDFGASSFAWNEKEEHIYFTTGESPYQINLNNSHFKSLDIDGLKDVHEIEIIDDKLWLSNTGGDEAVEINLEHGKVSKRIALKMLTSKDKISINHKQHAKEETIVEKFHCNQITTGYNDELLALVHHTSGEQVIRKIANKLIKNQGNGGVINLHNGDFIDLKLKSPHSIRKIEGNYWIFDSGNSRAHIYDKDWQLIKKINTAGFARGSDITKNGTVCAGISATRKRYLNIIKGGNKVPNMIQFFSGNSAEEVGQIEIPNIEQINNVYVIERNMAEQLLALH